MRRRQDKGSNNEVSPVNTLRGLINGNRNSHSNSKLKAVVIEIKEANLLEI